MSADYNYITDTGTITADTADILSDVQGEFRQSLGPNVNLAPSTAQGSLATTEAIARTSVMRQNAELSNQMNPNLSFGTFLDALCSFLGIGRGKNRSTVGTGVSFTANAKITVVAGSRVQTNLGDIYTVQSDVVFPDGGGVLSGTLVSQAFGPIPLPQGQLQMLDGVIGWTAVAAIPGTTVVLGTLALQDPQLKAKRNQQLAKQGLGSRDAIRAAVLDVDNVTSCQVIENNTGAAGVISGITFSKPNAMWVCVAGTPNLTDVANAIQDAHQGGCPWDSGTNNGTPQSIQVIDPKSLQPFQVLFTTAVLYDVYVNITVSQGTSVADPDTAVPNAMVLYASGQEDGEAGLIVGANISAYEMAGAVTRQLPGMYVKACSVAVVPAGAAAPAPGAYVQEALMNRWQQGNLQVGNVKVTTV